MVMNALLGPGCEEESWSPEVISLYGDADTIIQKLEDVQRDLPSRRVYIFTLETSKNSELAFYERTSPGKVTVSRWKGRAGPELRNKVHDAIIGNKGIQCVGEQTKAIVSKLPELKVDQEIAAPVNAKAAFSHQIRAQGEEYMSTSIYLMC
ncbi:hypothetical protein [Sinorhizobium meliloti]|uniref:hypothetical protein n=1 Tax=Rhizobium meliloti TaxID=382 RepID=UPI000FD90505|nr:hypothetical protein [Sinorhizobium meliloti]RVP20772.1 hypothetical protein CN080_21070 [Sinorhizobium meliloti]